MQRLFIIFLKNVGLVFFLTSDFFGILSLCTIVAISHCKKGAFNKSYLRFAEIVRVIVNVSINHSYGFTGFALSSCNSETIFFGFCLYLLSFS